MNNIHKLEKGITLRSNVVDTSKRFKYNELSEFAKRQAIREHSKMYFRRDRLLQEEQIYLSIIDEILQNKNYTYNVYGRSN